MGANRSRMALLGIILVPGFCRSSLSAETGVTDKEILIGSCTSLSGSNSLIGQQMMSGAQAYLDSVNANGGVYGRKIKLLSYDHKYDPGVTISCLKRLLAENVFALAYI